MTKQFWLSLKKSASEAIREDYKDDVDEMKTHWLSLKIKLALLWEFVKEMVRGKVG